MYQRRMRWLAPSLVVKVWLALVAGILLAIVGGSPKAHSFTLVKAELTTRVARTGLDAGQGAK